MLVLVACRSVCQELIPLFSWAEASGSPGFARSVVEVLHGVAAQTKAFGAMQAVARPVDCWHNPALLMLTADRSSITHLYASYNYSCRCLYSYRYCLCCSASYLLLLLLRLLLVRLLLLLLRLRLQLRLRLRRRRLTTTPLPLLLALLAATSNFVAAKAATTATAAFHHLHVSTCLCLRLTARRSLRPYSARSLLSKLRRSSSSVDA